MKTKIIISLLLIFVSQPVYSFGGVAEADSAYKDKNYKEAAMLYEKVIKEHGTSAELLFDLGNAYFQDGDYGRAMVNWQRARRLSPASKEINANIRYLQNRVEDFNKAEQRGKRMKLSADEDSFFGGIHNAIAVDTSSNTWAVWAAVLFIFFVLTAALYVFSRNVLLRKIGFFGGICFIFCSMLFLIFSFMGAREQGSEDEGVILAFKVTLLTEPGKDTDANKGGVLTKGTQVRILSEEVDAAGNVTWYKVRLNSDYIGWVAADDLEVI